MPTSSAELSDLDEVELLTRLMEGVGGARAASVKRALDADAARVASVAVLQARDVIEMARLLTEKRAAQRLLGRVVLDHPAAVRDFLVARLGSERREELGCLYLDASFAVIRYEQVAKGTTSAVVCYPREIARRCIELDATSVAMVHPHPSANQTVSDADVELTVGVREALSTLGITLLDHSCPRRRCDRSHA